MGIQCVTQSGLQLIDMRRRERFEITLVGIQFIEHAIASVLEEARGWEPPLSTAEIAFRAGVPAPRERALADFVLRQLEKSGRVVQIKQGRRTVGWRLRSYE